MKELCKDKRIKLILKVVIIFNLIIFEVNLS
jgi:hypothetical protein